MAETGQSRKSIIPSTASVFKVAEEGEAKKEVKPPMQFKITSKKPMAEAAAAAPAAAAAQPQPQQQPQQQQQPQEEGELLELPPYTYVPPYDDETLSEMTKFFKKRAKNPIGFTLNAAGDLETKEGAKVTRGRGAGAAAGTIRLKRFVSLEASELQALEEARLQRMGELDKEFEEEMGQLRKANELYALTGAMRDVLQSNRRLEEIDMQRSAVRAAVRGIGIIENPRVNDVILSDRYEERKLFQKGDPFEQELYRMFLYTFKAEVDQGKYVVDEGQEEQVVEEDASEMLYRQKLRDGRYARIFFDADSDVNGFLSPMWMVDFTLSVSAETKYSSPIQAYECERARELGKPEVAANILKTRSPRTIRLITRELKGHPADAKGLWTKIYTAVYGLHPILKAKLIATGSDALVFADVREGPSSVGLSDKDSGILDPAKWKSENAVGVAQETVRSRLKEGTEAEVAESDAPQESTITEEQQQKAKVGAIINSRR
jgi:predicted NAD-dependent protein-ADP-ribosyltransferase YbiA (DUF1768 family)